MMTITRHVLTTFLFHLLLLIIVGTMILITFPPDSYTELLTKKIVNMPFILFILLITFLFSVIIGITIAQYWKQRLQSITRYLNHMTAGQAIIFEGKYTEIKEIELELKKIEQKFFDQIEHIQQLATERANDREKSLQEVVIQERNRLARDLHDSVSQHLFAASMMMSAVYETISVDSGNFKHQIHQVEKMIHQAQLEMRALLLHLRPVALKGKYLQDGMKDLLMELSNRLPINISWKMEDFLIDKGVEDQLFRIVQEALSNALRHAEAENIQVMLIARDHLIILRLIDDGKGFNMDEVMTGSYGLENMKERARDLGGICKIISLPNKGTRVEVQVPVISKEG